MHREFHRNAACLADTRLDAIHQKDVDLVARRDVAAGLRNADDRAPALKLVARVFLVLVALDVKRGHARVVRIVEPFLRPETFVGTRVGHVSPPLGPKEGLGTASLNGIPNASAIMTTGSGSPR